MKKSGGEIWREGQAKIKKPIESKFVEKDWGHEIWMANNREENYCGKILKIYEGYRSSMHYHLKKHETFYILSGELRVDLIYTKSGNTGYKLLKQGDVMEIQRGQPHQLIAYDGNVELVETSTFHEDSDSYRVWR
jgi:mannose-6-phosphate isomerase-like protein (cupin superfamily)